MTRCKLVCAGAAALAFSCSAAAQNFYQDDFEDGDLTTRPEWSFADVGDGIPAIVLPPAGAIVSPTKFLGQFGAEDNVHLTLDLPGNVRTVSIKFDAYLLRTWDGADVQFAGPDTFGYGIAGQPNPILNATFSNGLGKQSYCPGVAAPCEPATGSNLALKNQLGFVVELEPVPGINGPPVGTPMSLVYNFDSGPIAYSGDAVTFNFFSRGLQVTDPNSGLLRVIDESWGLDNFVVNVTTVPEPGLPVLVLSGLAMLAGTGRLARQGRQVRTSRA